MKVSLDKGAICPTRAHSTDAGMDIYSPVDAVVRARNSTVIDTGVHIQLPVGTVGMLKSKSGLNIKGIQSEGVVDEGFSGSIRVKLYNHSDKDYWVYAGDKISQLVVMPVMYVGVELVEEVESGERGANGFGSTGR